MLAFGLPGTTEMVIIGVVGLLIFGNRLPSVFRSLGSSIVEFKRGLRGFGDETGDILRELEDTKKEAKKQIDEVRQEAKNIVK